MFHYFREWYGKAAEAKASQDYGDNAEIRERGIKGLQRAVKTFRGRVLRDHPDAKDIVTSIERDFPNFISDINGLAKEYNAQRKQIVASMSIDRARSFCARATEIKNHHLGHLL